MQREILLSLAQKALVLPTHLQHEVIGEAHWDGALFDVIGWEDLVRSSSARRAARSLVARGLLEAKLVPTETDYHLAGESFGTFRLSMNVRLPLVRFDPEVAELQGTSIAQHCRGITRALATVRQLADQEWRNYVSQEPDPQLSERFEAEVPRAERVVAYHLRQLDGFPAISSIGWPHVYTRHVAHWAYEAIAARRRSKLRARTAPSSGGRSRWLRG
jgi:hypothetical protein